MTNYLIEGECYTPKQVQLLCMALKRPVKVGDLDGIAMKPWRILGTRGAVGLDDDTATITDKGRAVIINVNSRVNRSEPYHKGKSKPASKPRPIPTKPNGHGVNFSDLRAQIVARYEADLAAVTRLEEIAKHLQTETPR